MSIPWEVELIRVLRLPHELIGDDYNLDIEERDTSSSYPVLTLYKGSDPIAEFEATAWLAVGEGKNEIAEIAMTAIFSNQRTKITLHQSDNTNFIWKTNNGQPVTSFISNFINDAKNSAPYI